MLRRAKATTQQVFDVLTYVYQHPANAGKRRSAMGRSVLFQLRGRLGMSTLTPIGDRARMWAVLHHAASSKVLYGNPPDWNEMQAWKRILDGDSLFVDVGSNIGSYALWAADCGASVIALEPGADAFTLLSENVSLNPGLRIELMACALADHEGEMYLTKDLDTINHLVLDPTADSVDRVEVRTLDKVVGLSHVRGVKIDVEGAERLVLAGACNAMSDARIDVFQLEWNECSESVLGETREPLFELLSKHGYLLFRPNEKGILEAANGSGYGPDIFAVSPKEILRASSSDFIAP
jgi:FkbM family methyltransferase